MTGNKKTILMGLISLITVYVVYYLLGSLIAWSFNIGDWHIAIRAIFAVLALISFTQLVTRMSEEWN